MKHASRAITRCDFLLSEEPLCRIPGHNSTTFLCCRVNNFLRVSSRWSVWWPRRDFVLAQMFAHLEVVFALRSFQRKEGSRAENSAEKDVWNCRVRNHLVRVEERRKHLKGKRSRLIYEAMCATEMKVFEKEVAQLHPHSWWNISEPSSQRRWKLIFPCQQIGSASSAAGSERR